MKQVLAMKNFYGTWREREREREREGMVIDHNTPPHPPLKNYLNFLQKLFPCIMCNLQPYIFQSGGARIVVSV
jgi:hypothetical protein